MTKEQRRALFLALDGSRPIRGGRELVRSTLYRIALDAGCQLDQETTSFVRMLLDEFHPSDVPALEESLA